MAGATPTALWSRAAAWGVCRVPAVLPVPILMPLLGGCRIPHATMCRMRGRLVPALRNGSLSSFAESLPCIHESAAFLDFIAWGAPLISHTGKVAQQTCYLSGMLSEWRHVESGLFMNKAGLLLRG